jgi:deferrochelatase/peroxidase EfeB
VIHNAAAKRPPLLRALETTGAAPFRRLPWADPADRRQHESDILLQFIANTELAVNRAIVETAKLIADRPLPLRIVTFYDGFGRDDRRSWIDFHDGINTMTPEDRLKVIELVNDTDIPWMVGGTFLAFLRTEVNLSVWRQRLTREQQELVIGRDKLTGCPLVGLTTGEGGRTVGVKIAGCPMSGTIPHPPPPGYIDAPRPGGEPVLLASHIHRANLNRTTDPALDSSNRVYRQGYEFLEPRPDGRLSQGLNFVSFQANLGRVRDMLSRREWLGGVNMGGGSAGGEPPDETILSVIAGGFYAVPPKGEPFPGAPLFDA